MLAIEFHYFSDGISHPACQGSLTADDFRRMLDYLENRYTLMNARDFLEAALTGTGSENSICLTFDDGVRSQLDIAVPVLEERGLTGMFFCYSSHFSGEPSMLEVYHDFRFRCFDSVDQFYDAFFETLRQDSRIFSESIARKMRDFTYEDYLPHCPWHSYSDKLFRYTRDCLITKEQYHALMELIMDSRGYDWQAQAGKLWIDAPSLRELSRKGHMIGLHSHTHPTNITQLSPDSQRAEYVRNQACLEEILGHPVQIAAYPCGKYNPQTLQIMTDLHIRLAFTAELTPSSCPLLVPRKNHPLVWKEMAALAYPENTH